MDGNTHYSYDQEASSNGSYESAEQLSTSQLQRLVQLLDGSDVSEIEVRRGAEGMHVVLRKARSQEQGSAAGLIQMLAAPLALSDQSITMPDEVKHTVTAALVGIFHSWARPKGGAVIAVGDRVKVGQLVGTIQALNITNEVESPVAGRVTEILVQDGQPVEYGQPLVIIDGSEEA